MGYNQFIINGALKFDLTGDTVDAAHLAQGYTAHGADGEPITGILAPEMELLLTYTLNDTCTTTTAAAVATLALGQGAYTSNGILCVRVRDLAGKRNGYFYGSDQFIFNRYPAQGATTTATGNNTSSPFLTISHRINANGTYGSYVSYTGYGIYGYSLSSAGDLVLRHRIHDTYAPTVDGSYKVDVYLLKGPFLDWFGS